jgi:branched-chain amino acid transport system substrate-binding protein
MQAGLSAQARLLGAVGLVLALTASASSAEETLKIGLVTTLSGGGAILGEELKRGWDLGTEMLGGRIGGLATETIVVDDQTKPEVAVTAIDKLLNQDKVQIVAGIVWSNILIAIYDAVIKSNTVLISTNAGASIAAGKNCSPLYITTSWQNDQFGDATLKLVQADGLTKAYMIAPNYQAGKDITAQFDIELKDTKVGETLFKLGQTDFQAELSDIRAKQPQSVIAFAPGAMSIAFMKQWKALNLSQSIRLYTINMVDELTLPALGDAALGTAFVSVYDAGQDIPANKKFVAAFKEKYKRLPTQYAAQAYDGVMLLDSGIRARNGNIDDRKALVAEMRKANIQSVRGPLRYNNNNFPIENMYKLGVVAGADGKPEIRGEGIAVKDQSDDYHQECKLTW